MDKELILKAVQAVMDFNEKQDGRYVYSVGINIGKHSIWIWIIRLETPTKANYILNNHDANSDDLNDFIQKLDELKAV